MKKIKFEKPTRVWVNAASKNNPLYKHHGKCGIVHQSINSLGNIETTLYFTEGPVLSMSIDPLYLETKNSQCNNLRI